jgi:acyl-CoA synthetase (AMP-forming)/AMP-acid ligase II/peptidoglycan/LPS O-acetylase OafA/YrhL
MILQPAVSLAGQCAAAAANPVPDRWCRGDGLTARAAYLISAASQRDLGPLRGPQRSRQPYLHRVPRFPQGMARGLVSGRVMGVDFLDRLAAQGTRPALRFEGGASLTYAELAARIALRRADLGTRRRLIFWSAEATADSIVTYLAALQAGHPILPLPPCDGGRRAELVAHYRPELIAAGGSLVESTGAMPAGDLHPDLALLLSTSGSTGSAKLVRLSAGNVAANAASIAEYLRLTPQDRSALVLPLHYSYGLSVLHAHLCAGASLYLPGGSILAPGFVDGVAQAGCTNLSGVPHSFELLEQIGFRQAALPDLRFMTVAGGRLAPDKVRLYAQHMQSRGGDFFVMYGQTEATARMAYLPPQDAATHADCIGAAIPGGTFRLVDEAGAEITVSGVMGELVYRGPNVMMGYAETRADLARGAELDELATGDYAERISAGYFRLLGRRQRFSKIAGLRIAHDAVEADLQGAGLAATVTGDDQRLLIAVSASAHLEAAFARAKRLTGLPANCLKVRVIADLPRRPSGKVDYRALAALFTESGDGRAAPAPLAQTRAAFADIFAPRQVKSSDSFASLGGDSLSFVELSLSLKPLLDPLPQGWEHWSVADLAAAAATARPAKSRRAGLALSSIDTDLALRGAAILLIVLHHATLWPMAGGAAILLTLVGYNLARHHARRLFAGDIAGMLRPCLRPVFIYYPLLLALCLAEGGFPWQSLLLVGNLGFDGYSTAGTPLMTFWFVEAYAQILLLMAALFAIPQLRRAVRQRPFATGLLGLGLALALRPLADLAFDLGEMRYFFTPRILYVPLIGWCLYFADTTQRKLVMSAVVAALVIGLMLAEGNAHITIVWVRALCLLAGAGLLLWLPRLYLPRTWVKPLTVVAAASFSIYLFHTLPYYAWLSDVDWAAPWRVPLYIVMGLGAGLGAHATLQRVGSRWRHMMAALLPRWQRS